MRMASAITMKMESAREIRMGTVSVITMKTASAAGTRTETASVITGRMSLIRRMRHMDLMSAGMDGIIRMAAETDLRMTLMGTDMVMAAGKAGKAGKDRR